MRKPEEDRRSPDENISHALDHIFHKAQTAERKRLALKYAAARVYLQERDLTRPLVGRRPAQGEDAR